MCPTLCLRNSQYYRRAIFFPLVDHITEMSAKFGPLQQKAAALFALVPPIVAEESKDDTAKACDH